MDTQRKGNRPAMQKPIRLSLLSLGIALQLSAFAVSHTGAADSSSVREASGSGKTVGGPRESIVFVGAHPDDTEGFAATAFLLRENYDLHVVDLTRGELGLGAKGRDDGSTAKIRMAEEAKACALLGAQCHFLDEVDGTAYASEKSVNRLAELFRALKPRAVFTHWPIDEHIDHVQCWAVVTHALHRAKLAVAPERYFFEVLLSQTRNFTPVYRVDVTRTIGDKAKLLRCYVCQNANDELAREKLEQAAFRGREMNPPVAASEVFTTFDGKPIPNGVLARLSETRVAVEPKNLQAAKSGEAEGTDVTK